MHSGFYANTIDSLIFYLNSFLEYSTVWPSNFSNPPKFIGSQINGRIDFDYYTIHFFFHQQENLAHSSIRRNHFRSRTQWTPFHSIFCRTKRTNIIKISATLLQRIFVQFSTEIKEEQKKSRKSLAQQKCFLSAIPLSSFASKCTHVIAAAKWLELKIPLKSSGVDDSMLRSKWDQREHSRLIADITGRKRELEIIYLYIYSFKIRTSWTIHNFHETPRFEFLESWKNLVAIDR